MSAASQPETRNAEPGTTLSPGLAALRPVPHPLLPPHTEAEADDWMQQLTVDLAGDRVLQTAMIETLVKRRQSIELAGWDESNPLGTDPFRDGFDLPHWADADWCIGWTERNRHALEKRRDVWTKASLTKTWAEDLRQRLIAFVADPLALPRYYILILLGGNRSGKSEYCARRVAQSAMRHANSLVVCLSETGESSIQTQQALVWKYLPLEIKKLNGRKDSRGVFKVKYSMAGGFTEMLLVLPNGSRIVFKTYNQEPGDIEGWMLGARGGRAIGGWGDESCTTGWFEAMKRRCAYTGSIFLWSFTPLKGMTPAIREAVGEAKTLLSLPAELLPANQRHVADCPKGEMPYLQAARTAGAAVLYFFSQFNPFGTSQGPFYDAVKEQCHNADGTMKSSGHVKRIAYGYTEDTTGRKFPAFSAVHVVRVEDIPAIGSIYQFTDPHGSRPWATIWVLVTPGKEPAYYVIRDWPSCQEYGEWAMPTQRETNDSTRKGWDGDPGPAQRENGWGIAHYKREWLKLEKIDVPAGLSNPLTPPARTKPLRRGEGPALSPDGGEGVRAKLLGTIKEPWRRQILSDALKHGRSLEDVREEPCERFMDSRFCNAQRAEKEGATCLKWQMEEETPDGAGGMLPPMFISEASGKDIEHGISLVSNLLAWNTEERFTPHLNAPRLYVSEECLQVRWMFENYTGISKESGASKEWADLCRHLAEADVYHETPEMFRIRGAREDDDE